MSNYRKRRRITFPSRGDTAKVSPRDVVRYLLANGFTESRNRRWFVNEDGERVPSPRRDDRSLEEVIRTIARRERRSSASVLRDIDAARWQRRMLRRGRSVARWPVA